MLDAPFSLSRQTSFGKLPRNQIAQLAVWALCVVFDSPSLDGSLCLRDSDEPDGSGRRRCAEASTIHGPGDLRTPN